MALLEVTDLTKRFGGLTANDSISFQVVQGEILGLIGPNGAGKTTLFNCIAGLHPFDGGTIRFNGTDINRLTSHEIARLGLARTFQIMVASGDLNVLENIMVGCFMHTASRMKAKAEAQRILMDMGLSDLREYLVSELPVAAQKRVALATALGIRPKLLLLDEVAAGLNPSEIESITATIHRIHSGLGVTVILIEHVMEMVMNLSQRVVVLDYGQKIAEGDPRFVVKDPNVIKAYLGERYAKEHV
jgi:branched-chain amino acid transport system ATP-binding protein